MTNYEKLISSIILSAVLSKTTYGLGCGCDCSDDDDDDTIESFKSTEEIKNNYYGSKINIKTPKITNKGNHTGWAKINGKYYYFNNEGVMQTGFLKNQGKWYFFNIGNRNFIIVFD